MENPSERPPQTVDSLDDWDLGKVVERVVSSGKLSPEAAMELRQSVDEVRQSLMDTAERLSDAGLLSPAERVKLGFITDQAAKRTEEVSKRLRG